MIDTKRTGKQKSAAETHPQGLVAGQYLERKYVFEWGEPLWCAAVRNSSDPYVSYSFLREVFKNCKLFSRFVLFVAFWQTIRFSSISSYSKIGFAGESCLSMNVCDVIALTVDNLCELAQMAKKKKSRSTQVSDAISFEIQSLYRLYSNRLLTETSGDRLMCVWAPVWFSILASVCPLLAPQ